METEYTKRDTSYVAYVHCEESECGAIKVVDSNGIEAHLVGVSTLDYPGSILENAKKGHTIFIATTEPAQTAWPNAIGIITYTEVEPPKSKFEAVNAMMPQEWKPRLFQYAQVLITPAKL